MQYSKDGKLVNTYESILNAAKCCNIHFSNIARAAKKETQTAGGYIWEYKKGVV
jgi:hypothetical protein